MKMSPSWTHTLTAITVAVFLLLQYRLWILAIYNEIDMPTS